jgi:ArsR family transcriptional regulator
MAETKKAQINLIFRAFSDPIRLRILCLLTGAEMCVGDLVKVLQVPQPTASRHLSYLRRAGLVKTRKNGLWVHYRLAIAKSAFHRNLLKCLGSCFHDVPEIADDAKRAGLVRKTGGCCPV